MTINHTYHFSTVLTLILTGYGVFIFGKSAELFTILGLTLATLWIVSIAWKEILLLLPGIFIIGLAFIAPQPWPMDWSALLRLAASTALWMTLVGISWLIQQRYTKL